VFNYRSITDIEDDWMGEIRHAYNNSVGQPEGKKPFGRPRHISKDYIRINLRGRGWDGVDSRIWLRIGTL
jgi:hypothetical protein